MSEKHNVKLSKALSWLLRHNMTNQGLEPTPEGFVYVDEVLRLPRFHGHTLVQVREVVRLNDKQRFALKQELGTGKWMIRANQGHSIKGIDPDLVPITDASAYPLVIHGTFLKNWNQGIKENGLNRMSRNHIHFARGTPGSDGVISGMRAECDVLIHIDLDKALKDGFKFFESANKVILCPGDENGFLPTRYFSKAIHKPRGKKGKEYNLLEKGASTVEES